MAAVEVHGDGACGVLNGCRHGEEITQSGVRTLFITRPRFAIIAGDFLQLTSGNHPTAMSRQYQIRESLDELRELERLHFSKPRLLMLRRIKENTLGTFASFATEVGYSESAVKRWWRTYRDGGIDALLTRRETKRNGRSDAEQLEELRQKLDAGAFTSLGDLRRWIEAGKMTDGESEGVRYGEAARRGIGTESQPQRELPELPERIIEFLNALPTTGVVNEWVEGFRHALLPLLGNVDRIIISVNVECDLENPESYNPNRHVTQILAADRHVEKDIQTRSQGASSESREMLARMQRTGFPFERYHHPYVFGYFFRGRAYLGTMLLLRERSKSPIDEQSIRRVKQLRSFMEFAFSYCVSRYQISHPESHAFDNRLREIVSEYNLTEPERDLLTLQFMGKSYNEIAASMGISIETVSSHVRSIHRKTGVRNILKLFAQYFTPLVTMSKGA
jgi:DNA-binding CsgD family transcriptional regulator